MFDRQDNYLQVRLSDIVANFRYFQNLNRAAAVVKADAYGLGMAEVATALSIAGATEFFTFTLKEAASLRGIMGGKPRIYFLSGLVDLNDAEHASNYRVVPILNRWQEVLAWQKAKWHGAGKEGKPLCVHVDSGMNRLGLSMQEWQKFCDFYKTHEGEFSPPLVVSHLACSDDKTHKKNAEQLHDVTELLQKLPTAELSLSASFGAALGAEYHASQLRIGIGLYGVGEGGEGLKNPFEWQARILQIRTLQAGETIGYGATPVEKNTCAAIIACGYADGLRRSFANGGSIFIHGTGYPLLGRVSMDCCAVDIGNDTKIKEGDFAEIIGKNQSLQNVADVMQTIPYEVLCGIGKRVIRKIVA